MASSSSLVLTFYTARLSQFLPGFGLQKKLFMALAGQLGLAFPLVDFLGPLRFQLRRGIGVLIHFPQMLELFLRRIRLALGR